MNKNGKFGFSKEERKAIHFFLTFSVCLACCMVLAVENIGVGIILTFLLCYMPFAFLDWYLEPSDEQKELRKKMDELLDKLKRANERLEEIVK